jgi:conjugal transfer/entry exclusion protein
MPQNDMDMNDYNQVNRQIDQLEEQLKAYINSPDKEKAKKDSKSFKDARRNKDSMN